MSSLRTLRGVVGLITDAAEAAIFAPWTNTSAVDELWNRGRPTADARLDEIAEHLAAIRALLEDTRNLLQHERRQHQIRRPGCTCDDPGRHQLYCPYFGVIPTTTPLPK